MPFGTPTYHYILHIPIYLFLWLLILLKLCCDVHHRKVMVLHCHFDITTPKMNSKALCGKTFKVINDDFWIVNSLLIYRRKFSVLALQATIVELIQVQFLSISFLLILCIQWPVHFCKVILTRDLELLSRQSLQARSLLLLHSIHTIAFHNCLPLQGYNSDWCWTGFGHWGEYSRDIQQETKHLFILLLEQAH